MQLGNIFEAREAWQHLTSLKLPPHTAYRILKYARKLTAEAEVIEQQRVKLLKERTTADELGQIQFKPGTPEYNDFAVEFAGKFLETEADLKPFDMKLSSLLDLIGKEAGNLLSVQDLGRLEPFFLPEE
jgi:hypothetical protein